MKTVKTIATALLVCASFFSQAQKTDSIRYGGLQQLSLAFGEHGPGLGFSFVNGIRYKKFFVGLGADYFMHDDYAPSTALYLDGRYYINKAKNFFVKTDGGVNFMLSRRYGWDYEMMERMPGYYFGVGLGFKARVGKELFYTFDLSYVQRQRKYNYTYRDWRFPNEWLTEKHDIRIPMIVLNLGLEIF